MVCGTSERVPVSALIHLLPRKTAISALRAGTARAEYARTWATSAANTLVLSHRSNCTVTYRVYVDRF